jgi:molecular chaperone DnaK (HSP70)
MNEMNGTTGAAETIVGIDLGTTNSEIAVVRDGRVEVIPISGATRILPSVVGIGDDGALLVGEAARNQYAVHPERTVRSIKRRMGEDTRVSMAGKDYAPQEISAMILHRLKSVAQAHLGFEVSKAVITVPAFFSDAQRQATREAGQIAGLEVVRIINEPTAAALAYESRHQGARKALVYDLGGGTFDVSVVNLEGDVVEVLASHGNNHLGGDDFDRKLVDHALTHLKQTHDIDASTSPAVMARLQRAAETAKIALSDRPFATMSEEFLLEHQGVPLHLALEVSREEYEAMIEPYIAETLNAVHVALSGANLSVSEIDEILLVGGATRTPLVARRLEEQLGKQPRAEVDPDLCVAMGAAIQAGLIAGTQTHTVLVDITPYTFGTSALGLFDDEPYVHCFVPLIRKNTPIPVSKSEVFFTAQDGQSRVEVTVYQGEDRDALNNIQIGRFMVEGLSKVPSGNPIVISLSLDLNGILEVTALEKRSGLARSITIGNAIARFEQGKLDEARSRVQALFGPQADGPSGTSDAATEGEQAGLDARRLGVEARALLEKAERVLEKVGTQDAEDLVNAVEGVKDALASGEAGMKPAMDTLTDLLYYLEA